ncbi:MAG: signal peptidase I [Bacteroidales bacterium]|jgi:signal peptidase I|nr:signal peptidase I [Bacteroidales bacterium]
MKHQNKIKTLKFLAKHILRCFLYLLFAVIFGISLRVFLLVSCKVPTPSMTPAILPGDYILVNKMIPGPRIFTGWGFLNGTDFEMKRLKGYRKVKRNDVLVFNFPYSDWNKLQIDLNVFYAKRCVAIPGDTLYIDSGIYRVKGVDETLGCLDFQLRVSNTPAENFPPGVYRCFPFHDAFGWNIRDFGPLYVPGAGDAVTVDSLNVYLYKNLIEYETGYPVTVRDGQVFRNGHPIREYVFRKNYYFMAGDYAPDSRDSRYWGLLPEDHIVGKAFVIWRSSDMQTGKWKWKRFFTPIQ